MVANAHPAAVTTQPAPPRVPPAPQFDANLLHAILSGTPLAQLCETHQLHLPDLLAWFRSGQTQALIEDYFALVAIQQRGTEAAALAKAIAKLDAIASSSESQAEQRKASTDLLRTLRDKRAAQPAAHPAPRPGPAQPQPLSSFRQSISKLLRPPVPQPTQSRSNQPPIQTHTPTPSPTPDQKLSQFRLEGFITSADESRGIIPTQSTPDPNSPPPSPKVLQAIIPKLEGLTGDPFLPESEVRALNPEACDEALPAMRRMLQEDTVLQGAIALLNHGTYRNLPAAHAVHYVREFLQNRASSSLPAPNATAHPPPDPVIP